MQWHGGCMLRLWSVNAAVAAAASGKRTGWRDSFQKGGSLTEPGACCHWFSVHILPLGEKSCFQPRFSLPLYACSQEIRRFLFKIFAVNLS